MQQNIYTAKKDYWVYESIWVYESEIPVQYIRVNPEYVWTCRKFEPRMKYSCRNHALHDVCKQADDDELHNTTVAIANQEAAVAFVLMFKLNSMLHSVGRQTYTCTPVSFYARTWRNSDEKYFFSATHTSHSAKTQLVNEYVKSTSETDNTTNSMSMKLKWGFIFRTYSVLRLLCTARVPPFEICIIFRHCLRWKWSEKKTTKLQFWIFWFWDADFSISWCSRSRVKREETVDIIPLVFIQYYNRKSIRLKLMNSMAKRTQNELLLSHYQLISQFQFHSFEVQRSHCLHLRISHFPIIPKRARADALNQWNVLDGGKQAHATHKKIIEVISLISLRIRDCTAIH